MKAVILAGGLGTRITEETVYKPKPMVEVGGKPILWHIMKIYSHYGINDFVICAGYKAYIIKEFFANYFLYKSNVTFDLAKSEMQIHDTSCEPWRITVVDTGENTMTGGRIKRIKQYVQDDDFCLTYGDGVSNVNIADLIAFHKNHGALATLTAVSPTGRFGSLGLDPSSRVEKFQEKPTGEGWINAGFFVLNPKVIDYIEEGDESIWERQPLESLSKNNQLFAYKHNDFWQPMDTLRDKMNLDSLWERNEAPWKLWKD